MESLLSHHNLVTSSSSRNGDCISYNDENSTLSQLLPNIVDAPKAMVVQANKKFDADNAKSSRPNSPSKNVEVISSSRVGSAAKQRVSGNLIGLGIVDGLRIGHSDGGISDRRFGSIPASGGWIGFYTTSDREMIRVFYEMMINISERGELIGTPRQEHESMACRGTVTSDEIQRIEFVESVKRFEGLFVEGAIAGRWRNVDSKIHGRLCLYHISESSPAKIFRPGRWVGCYWNDTEGLWEQVTFPWLDIRKKYIYGKDDETDDNVFKTTRGIFNEKTGQLLLFTTEWFEQDSTISVFSGRLSSHDGSIRGMRVVNKDPNLEESLVEMEEKSSYKKKPMDFDDEALFKMWRVDGTDSNEWMGIIDNASVEDSWISDGKWAGRWTYEQGSTVPDHCSWNIIYCPKTRRIIGSGISKMEDLEEKFFCDGTFDLQTKKVKMYQTFITTLIFYVYDLILQDDGSLVGTGYSKDDSDGLVVTFALEPVKK